MWWSCHLMRCDCLCCVMSRDAMRCHVMCAHVMCPAMVRLCVRSGSVTIWWSKVLFCTTKNSSVLQSTTPVLLCTTLYYSVLQSTTPLLLQYYSVLQSTTPVLLCTTPVLLCTTKYYFSTTLYYKVLLQYYSVLHSTTTYYSSTTLYYKVLLCTAKYYSSTTLYYKVLLQYYRVLLQYYSVLQSSIHDWSLYEPLFTLRGATGVILQLHQILHLPRKMTVMIDPRHIWNVIYNARSNKSHPPTSPNTALATQNECHQWSASHMKRHFQYAEQVKPPLKLTKYCACHEIRSSRFQGEIRELLPPI